MKLFKSLLKSIFTISLLLSAALVPPGSAYADDITVAYFMEWPTPNQYAQSRKIYDEALGVDVKWAAFDTGTAISAPA
ncbi:MAG: hypothetical protein OQL16_02745 [Gammaproteobacteria bacterium]|nr:hypothetical protein [Gammaproteobacteria bacterium]